MLAYRKFGAAPLAPPYTKDQWMLLSRWRTLQIRCWLSDRHEGRAPHERGCLLVGNGPSAERCNRLYGPCLRTSRWRGGPYLRNQNSTGLPRLEGYYGGSRGRQQQ